MDYIVSYDIGTSGIKCGIFDREFNCAAITRFDYEVAMNGASIAEAEPEDYVTGLAVSTREALEKSGVAPEKVAALCITTQGETLIPINREGKALTKAIVWLDGRASKEAQELKKKFPDRLFREKTGLPGVDGYTPLAKLMYIREKMPEVYEQTYKFLLLEDYVLYRLTGETVSEKSLLSSTGYFDLTTDSLWEDVLAAAGIPGQKIPEVADPGQKIGQLTEIAAEMLGLTVKTGVFAGAMDQLCGAVGCGNLCEGDVHETTGTAMVVASTMGLEECMKRDRNLTVYRHVEKGKYLLLTIGRTATTVLKWFGEQFYRENRYGKIYEELSRVTAAGNPGANGVICLPYFEGMPECDESRGIFWNVGLHNTREDFVRAVFEGVAYMLKDQLKLMFGEEAASGKLISIGGASRSDIWCRIKADVTGKEIVTVSAEEATLFGCACIAAVSMGWYGSLEEASKKVGTGSRYVPDQENKAFYEREYVCYERLKRQMIQLYREQEGE